MGLVDDWHEQYAKREAVQYVFDHTETGRGEIADIWKMMAQEPEAAARGGCRPDGWSIQKKELCKPLQAADILAWNQHSNIRDQVLKKSSSVSPYFMVLRENRPMALGFFTDAQMKKMFDDGAEYERKHGKRIYAVPKWKSLAPTATRP